MAFFALQLSVFTCGFAIHVHAMDADVGHVAEHLHGEKSDHEQSSTNHGCHVHSSHNFTVSEVDKHKTTPLISTVHQFIVEDINLKNLPSLIEYPPKALHS